MKAIALALAATAAAYLADGPARFAVTAAGATLVQRGVAAAAPSDPEAAGFERVPPPGIQFRRNVAQATEAPWVASNGWRFARGLERAYYATLPAGSATLAAAEAFAYGVRAVLNPDAADVPELGQMLEFLNAREQPPLPVMANIALVDDGSPEIPEVLNMLTRRNLLYRVVSAPDPQLVTVRLGTNDFPREAAKDPSDFAARVREKVGDDNRLVRIYGTSTVIARLTGDGRHARLFLIAYGATRRRQTREQQNVRIRVAGKYQPSALAAYGAAPDARLLDVDHPGPTTEFSLPIFSTLAIVDLKPIE